MILVMLSFAGCAAVIENVHGMQDVQGIQNIQQIFGMNNQEVEEVELPFAPLWEQHERFRSEQQTNMQTNRALENSLRNFWRAYGRNANNIYDGDGILFYDEDGRLQRPSGYNLSYIMNLAIRESLTEGFVQDRIVLPFSQEFIDEIFDNIQFYFATLPLYWGVNIAGYYSPEYDHSTIFVDTESFDSLFDLTLTALRLFEFDDSFQLLLEFGEDFLRYIYHEMSDSLEAMGIEIEGSLAELDALLEEQFVFVTLHEIAHAFGLGESLADLFAEVLMRRDASAFEIEMYEGFPNSNYTPLGEFRGDLRFIYDSTFDRSLLSYIQAQGREHEFWEAAFHSNSKYGELWDEAFGEYISALELQLARGVYNAAIAETRSDRRPRIAPQFEELSNGIYIPFAAHMLMYNWHNILYGEDDDGSYFYKFRWLVEIFNEVASTHDIEIQPMVLDFVIESHIQRYEGIEE